MTSKHCFSNFMREDFKHRIWMLALSVLGNVLALPVMFLFYTDNNGYNASEYANHWALQAHSISAYLTSYLPLGAGFIALVGAIIVGIGGFRYLYHRNMVDTFESLPIKKRDRFLAVWLNGFLIWFIPFIICFVLTIILDISKYQSLHQQYLHARPMDLGTPIVWWSVGEMTLISLKILAALVVGFFLVYNMAVLAVMLCGNVLNTMVVGTTLGAGAFGLTLLFETLGGLYLRTWVSDWGIAIEKSIFFSPLAAAVYTLAKSTGEVAEQSIFSPAAALLIGALAAAILMVLAWVAYEKRASELAEQGTKNKVVSLLTQVIASLAAAMCGWIVMNFFANGLFWCVFGAVLTGWFIFEVLNVIFEMDFKAFFHKPLFMVGTVGAAVLIGFVFKYDLIGYDTYLPKADKIASIQVHCPEFSAAGWWGNTSVFDDEDVITDNAKITAFLQAAVEQDISDEVWYDIDVYVKVTKTNGKSYKRQYMLTREDFEAALAIFEEPAYMESNYKIPEEIFEQITRTSVNREGVYDQDVLGNRKNPDKLYPVLKAYNQDVLENPEAVAANPIAYCNIDLQTDYGYPNYTITVREGMEHTLRAMKEAGLEEMVTPMDAKNIEMIMVDMPIWYLEDESILSEQAVADWFGVDVNALTEGLALEEFAAQVEAGKIEAAPVRVDPQEDRLVSPIENPEEIAKIVSGASYTYDSTRLFLTRDARSTERFEVCLEVYPYDGPVVSIFLTDKTDVQKYLRGFLYFLYQVKTLNNQMITY